MKLEAGPPWGRRGGKLKAILSVYDAFSKLQLLAGLDVRYLPVPNARSHRRYYHEELRLDPVLVQRDLESVALSGPGHITVRLETEAMSL